MGGQQAAHLVEGSAADLGRRGDAVTAGGDVVDERLRGDVVRPLDLMGRTSVNGSGSSRSAAPVVFQSDDPAEVLDPAQTFVPHVPQQAQSPARPQHADHLGDRPFRVEPVPGLGHQYRVNAVVRQRNLFGGAQQVQGCRAVSRAARRAFR